MVKAGILRKTKLGCVAALALGCVQLAACAHTPKSPSADQELDGDDADSLESFNRAMHDFNTNLDYLLLKPASEGYRYVMPQTGRAMVSNFLDNLNSPVVFVNSVMQGDPQNSFATLWRFLLNTTFGLGGTVDFAGNAGLKNRPADFGQTMGMCGIEPGPYVVLPLMGPSNVRDGFGLIGDMAMDPLSYTNSLEVIIPRATMTIVDARSRNGKLIDEIYDSSIDPYVTFRSAYTQKRISDIRRGEASRQKALEQMPPRQ